jgi:hypothetical protein
MKRAAQDDPDYNFDADLRRQSKQPTKANAKQQAFIAKPMSKDDSKSFFQNNSQFVLDAYQQGSTPATIADMLSAKVKRPGAITNKQVSNFLYQKKKAGQLKTKPVSASNTNLRANTSHQAKGCMSCD